MKNVFMIMILGLLITTGMLAQEETPEPAETVCFDAAIPNPTPSYYIGLGAVQFLRGSYTEAIQSYSCAIELQPDYAPSYSSRGYAYAALQDVNRAFSDYEQALLLDETLIAAYNNRGVLYTTQGNFGLAINDFTLAVTLEPNSAVSFNNRGVVHAIEGNYDLALADFEQALTIDPSYAMPHASIAAVYSAMAVQHYQLYIETAGDNASLPAGTPEQVIGALDTFLRDGDFSIWLSLLTPER